MSEYWKSTPKYWCKYCKDYIKDTKFEKQQHEATPRHQGNIQRSLRTLHREKEQQDRQKQRAKDEVARLNGVVGSKSAGSPSSASLSAVSASRRDAPRQASADERKKQIKQLADMGVAVPDEFRREMAMAGDWQTLTVTPIPEDQKDGPNSLAFGVRKRKLEEEAAEETAEAAMAIKHKQWGSRFKTYPGKKSNVDDEVEDVQALLGGIVTNSKPENEKMEVKKELGDVPAVASTEAYFDELGTIKKEEFLEESPTASQLEQQISDNPIKAENTATTARRLPGAGILFKKRKPKVTRQI